MSRTINEVKDRINKSREFAQEAIATTARTWKEEDFAAYASSEFNTPERKAQTKKMFAVFNQKLGKLVKLEPIKDPARRGIRATEKGFQVSFKTTAEFEKGKGEFEITVQSKGENRVVSDIKLNSPALFELSEKEVEKAKTRLKDESTSKSK
jgi:ParB-like chromosome segregation protein Spo0J